MENLHDGLAAFSAQLWPVLINHLWQSTLFVLALLPALAFLRRAPARVRYRVWLVAAAKLALPSALLLLVLPASAAPLLAELPGLATLAALDLGWLLRPMTAEVSVAGGGHSELNCILTLVWLAGATALLARWRLRQRRFARALAGARRVGSSLELELLAAARERLGVRRRVALALLDGTAEPGVWRTWRPVLVLPAGMPRHLEDAELEAIFLHELVHVRRWDNLVASLHMMVCCLFWFHPLVWLLDRRLLAEREEACDEKVLELGGRAEIYARGLLKAMRFGLGWNLAGVSSASASNFRRRVERILARGGPPRLSWLDRSLTAAGVALLAAFSVAGGDMVAVVADDSGGPGGATAWSRPAATDGGAQAGAEAGESCAKKGGSGRRERVVRHGDRRDVRQRQPGAGAAAGEAPRGPSGRSGATRLGGSTGAPKQLESGCSGGLSAS